MCALAYVAIKLRPQIVCHCGELIPYFLWFLEKRLLICFIAWVCCQSKLNTIRTLYILKKHLLLDKIDLEENGSLNCYFVKTYNGFYFLKNAYLMMKNSAIFVGRTFESKTGLHWIIFCELQPENTSFMPHQWPKSSWNKVNNLFEHNRLRSHGELITYWIVDENSSRPQFYLCCLHTH